MDWDSIEDRFGGVILLLAFLLIVGRGIYIVRQAHTYSCPNGQTVAIDFLAVPLVQDTVSCEQGT